MAALRSAFKGRRGAALVVEGVAQATAAGLNPNIGKSPDNLPPNLQGVLPAELLEAARGAIMGAFGVLPCLFASSAQGNAIRETATVRRRYCDERCYSASVIALAPRSGQDLALSSVARLKQHLRTTSPANSPSGGAVLPIRGN